MRVVSVIHHMVSGQYYQSYSLPVDERLYRDLTDDITGDLMSQSYKKRRRSCDLYELVVLVWEILTVISRHIQVGRDLTPTFCAVFYRRGRFTKIGSETDVLFCLIKITANKRSSTRARTHIRLQCKGTGMIHDISKLLEFPICVCTDYDMYRGHGSIQGMRGVRQQRQQEE